MRTITMILAFLFSASAYGQRLPNQFPQKSNAEGTDELYTQAGGTAYRIILDSVRMFMIPDIDLTALSYEIDSTGLNVVDSLRGRFVIDLSGDWWYVDKDKKAVALGGGGGSGTITGSGTANRITLWDGSSSITDVSGLSVDQLEKVLQLPSQWGMKITGGTTAQRIGAGAGRLYYNTTKGKFEWSNASQFRLIESLRDSLIQDSILVYYTDGVEIGRDTIRVAGSGGGAPVSDTSRHSHTRLAFGDDYTVPLATLDTADVVSVYGGAQTSTSVTITLPTIPDTSYDGKIIFIRGSSTENGDIFRVTSPDSTDILVQGCVSISVVEESPTDSTNIDINLATTYANTAGPDTITFTSSAIYMYIISNAKYYRFCQDREPEAPYGKIFQINMATAATSTTVDFNAPTNPENTGVYTFHFRNTASNDVDFPATFKTESGTAWDESSTYNMAGDFFMTCYYDGTNYYCK